MISIQAMIPGVLVFLIEGLLDDVLIQRDPVKLAILPVTIVVLYVLNGAITFGRGMLTRHIAWEVVTLVRRELFESMLHQDAAWHQSTPTGSLLARMTHDVSNIQHGVSGIVTALQKPLTLVVLIVCAFVMNAKLAAVGLVVLPFVAIPIHRFGHRLRERTQQTQDSLAQLTGSSSETLAGIGVVKVFGGESSRLGVFDRDNEDYRRRKMDAFAARLLPGPIVEVIAAIGVAAVVWFGGQQVFAGTVQPGELIAFMVAMGFLNDPLKGLTSIVSLTQRAVAGAQSVFAVLDRPSSVADTGRRELTGSEAVVVTFEGVGFDYGDGVVIEDVSLELQPGRVVALVGASGSGKSTIAKLVARLYDVTTGRVLVNGTDVREYTLASLRGSVAVVSQEPFLFDDTVAANIAFGVEATHDQIVLAAQSANAHEFISALPNGYQTRIDEQGMRLSGGQRQRICIARAVLADSPVLILDEATSALDAHSEQLVHEALQRLMLGRSVLCIAHRLSTIRGADEILVMDSATIVERGDHGSLMDAGGAYAHLVSRQRA